jgi:NarL family two-component system response regulator LiaR
MSDEIRILIVDDHPLMREALQAAIVAEPGMQTVGEAGSGREAVMLTHQLNPDVILMDLLMPEMDGVEATKIILAEHPQAKILTFTSMSEEGKVVAAIQAGALGFITKDAPRKELMDAIRIVATGEPCLPPEIALKLFQGVRKQNTHPLVPYMEDMAEALTPRQEEVLSLLGRGYSNTQIAQSLHLSEATVRSHINHILNRLGLERRAQAIAYASRRDVGAGSSPE